MHCLRLGLVSAEWHRLGLRVLGVLGSYLGVVKRDFVKWGKQLVYVCMYVCACVYMWVRAPVYTRLCMCVD